MPRDADFAVIEIGMNHPGEIAPLARLARPHVALITTVEAAHIGHMGSLEAIAREKGSIALGLDAGGIMVLPADTPMLPILRDAAAGARILTFGEGGDAHPIRIAADTEGSDIEAEIAGARIAYRLGTPGLHMARNSIAALAAVAAIGADVAAGAARGWRISCAMLARRSPADPHPGWRQLPCCWTKPITVSRPRCARRSRC